MEEVEEDIPVKYRLSGETEWETKKEAVMKLGETQWAIRLKLCKQGDGHHYYSLHVAQLTTGHVSRVQIKCGRDGVEKSDWLQEYTFGGQQTVLVNPCLMKIADQKDKVTFVVELKLMHDEKVPEFVYPKEITFPSGDYALKVGDKKLIVDPTYLRRRAPLLGYMFEDGDKKEFDVEKVEFQDLVDAFGVFQHHWEFSAPRLLHLIPIARKLGFDIWGKALNREFRELMYRGDPVEIVPKDDEEPVKFQFNETLHWEIDDIENIGSSTTPDNQNLMVTWEEKGRSCIVYAYTQDILDRQYLSLGFQMSRPSTSTDEDATSAEGDVNVTDDDDDSEDGPENPKYFDIEIHLLDEDGNRIISDKISRIRDDEYVIVGSPVFALFDDVMQHVDPEGKVTFEFNWIQNYDYDEEDEWRDHSVKMPGQVNGEILCEGKTVQINKEYLSYHSEYFRGFFSKRWNKQSRVQLPVEKFDILVMALNLLYDRRQMLTDVDISRIMDFADRTCIRRLIDGLENQLWSCKAMDLGDKKWLAEQFNLTDLEIKCTMEQKEQQRAARASRKRPCPPEFQQNDGPEAPPAPTPTDPQTIC